MKKTLTNNILIIISLLISLTGCNNEVFVDDYKPSETEFTFGGNGGSGSFSFQTDALDQLSISCNDRLTILRIGYDGETIDETYGYGAEWDSSVKTIEIQAGKDSYMRLTRVQSDRLDIECNGNIRNHYIIIDVKMYYSYKTDEVRITWAENRNPTFEAEYTLTAISYDKESVTCNADPWIQDASTTFHNNTAKPMECTILYDNYNFGLVKFTLINTQHYIKLAENQPSVSIPTVADNGIPGFYGKFAPFSTTTKRTFPMYMPGHTESTVVEPMCAMRADVLTYRHVLSAYCYVTLENSETKETEQVECRVQVFQPYNITVKWSDVPLQR